MSVDLSEFTVIERDKCKLMSVVKKLDESDREKVIAAVAEVDVTLNSIVEFLKKRGHVVGRTVVQMHRAGTCVCG